MYVCVFARERIHAYVLHVDPFVCQYICVDVVSHAHTYIHTYASSTSA